MANAIGTCSDCGATGVAVTIEHVFPESWYPDEFPPSQMLTVPSCPACNHGRGQQEQSVFLPLVSTLPPDSRTASLVDRALRSADPNAGRNAEDSAYRRRTGEALLGRATIIPPGSSVPDALWMRGGPQSGQVGETADGTRVEGMVALPLPHERVARVIVKFLRGCYYAVYSEPLPQKPEPWVVSFTDELQPQLAQFVALPGVVTRGSFPFSFSIVRSGGYAFAWFALWEHLLYFASNGPQVAKPRVSAARSPDR